MRDSAERKSATDGIRPAIGAQGYQLSVDDRVIREMVERCRDVRKLLVEHVLAPRVEESSSELFASPPDSRLA